MDVSDRSLQAKLTQEAKITSASSLSEVIFAFGGFISALRPQIAAFEQSGARALYCIYFPSSLSPASQEERTSSSIAA